MAKAAVQNLVLDIVELDTEDLEGEPSDHELLESEQWLDEIETVDQGKMLERLYGLKEWYEEIRTAQEDGDDVSDSRREFTREIANFAADAVDVCGPAKLGEFFYHVERLVSSLEFHG